MATADPGIASWTPINMWAMLRALINNGTPITTNAGAPTNGTSGTYAGQAGKGAVLLDFTNGVLYINTGTLASPFWTQTSSASIGAGPAVMTPTLMATGQISPANIIGTGAGQLGHAQGVILVPAAPAGSINELISAVVSNDFLTAAYTGAAGNVTVNISGGGAALTGVVTGTVLIQAAADIIVELVPLAATKNTYTAANGLALVSTAAPTNPGTAAGVLNWAVAYRTITALLD